MGDGKKEEQSREHARDLILEVWRSVDWDGVSGSRRMGIYDEFQAKVQSAAMTSSLGKFVERLARKMGVRSLNNTRADGILRECDHATVLDLLRTETSMIVIMMRVWQEEHRQEFSVENMNRGA